MAAQKELADWELRQVKTFSKWCNMYLARKGHSDCQIGEGAKFAESWGNGIALMKLMNALFDVPMPRKYRNQEFFDKKEKAQARVFSQDNVAQALKMVDKAEVKTTNLKSIMIMDEDFKTLAGMVWNVILDYNLKGVTDDDITAKQGLLIWCQKKTKTYKGVEGKIDNFHRDWTNGNAFLALVDKHTQGLVDYNGQYEQTKEEKLDAAFTACEGLGIARLLEVDDVVNAQKQDEKSIMTYVSELFKLFSKEDIKDNAATHLANFLRFQRRIEQLQTDYESRFKEIQEWVEGKIGHFSEIEEIENASRAGEVSAEYKNYLTDEKPHKLVDILEIQELYSSLQGELKSNGRPTYSPPEGLEVENLNNMAQALQDTENSMMGKVNDARVGFVESIKVDEGVSEERAKEFDHSFDVFDADKSGHLNKVEFKAALSAVGVSLNETDFNDTFKNLCSEEMFIERETYIKYLTAFFTNTDDADSVMKSLQVLTDPQNAQAENLNYGALTEDDIEYLMSKADNGSLEAFIAEAFPASA